MTGDEEIERRKGLGFLEAEGLKPLPRLCRGTEVTPRFKSYVYDLFLDAFGYSASRYGGSFPSNATAAVWKGYFEKYTDELPGFQGDFNKFIKSYISDGAKLLDLLQFCARTKVINQDQFKLVKALLEQELIGYRFVGEWYRGEATLIPISDEAEADANQADFIEAASFPNARQHFLQAVEELKASHYRGSVTESISGVESVVKSLTGKPGVTLGDGLKLLNNGNELHPALKKGLESIYGWTNSPSGMRHALSEEAKEVTEAEARYMLSACLAFSAWLKRTASTG